MSVLPNLGAPIHLVGLCLLGLAALLTGTAHAEKRNGFSLEPAAIPTEEILRGGPARDGIPALDHPDRLPAEDPTDSCGERRSSGRY